MQGEYKRPAAIMHWLIAVGVLTQFGLGWWMRSLPDKTGVQAYWFNLHKSIGLTVLLLVVAMLVWRWRHPPPPLPATLPRWQWLAAKTCHWGIYVCLLVMPLSGYMGSSFTRFPIRYFGVVLPNFWGWESPELKALCSLVHLCVVIVFMALVALHIAAAVKHAIDGDGLNGRMWPWRRGPG